LERAVPFAPIPVQPPVAFYAQVGKKQIELSVLIKIYGDCVLRVEGCGQGSWVVERAVAAPAKDKNFPRRPMRGKHVQDAVTIEIREVNRRQLFSRRM
jgi:hypothetical protein